ncbi:MAG TPA: hypothetical protein VGG74_04615 [Kofleriaceae bacterium]|jgi:hypothetical protein
MNIDLDQLANVCGGASKSAPSVMLDKLNDKFGSQGVVSYIGTPKFGSPNKSGVESGSGKFDVNALWGGDQQYSFRGSVNAKTGAVSGLKTKLLGSE